MIGSMKCLVTISLHPHGVPPTDGMERRLQQNHVQMLAEQPLLRRTPIRLQLTTECRKKLEASYFARVCALATGVMPRRKMNSKTSARQNAAMEHSAPMTTNGAGIETKHTPKQITPASHISRGHRWRKATIPQTPIAHTSSNPLSGKIMLYSRFVET